MIDEARLERAFWDYDGDVCRPESGISPAHIAGAVLVSHYDLATCFCPLCVLARAFIQPREEAS